MPWQDVAGRWAALALVLGAAAWAQEEPLTVAVQDGGVKPVSATWECSRGHQVQKQTIRLTTGETHYALAYQGCTDPSHGEQRPCSEGNFGMPEPLACNWYWGGFLRVMVNGTDALAFRQREMRVLETGARGELQAIFEHPDAVVGLRWVLLPGANHLLGLLTWQPRAGATLKSVTANLTCYPSFFTTSRGRQGERHCQTPRINLAEPQTLELKPAEDPWLFYHDTIFDVARGEGDGPCALGLGAGITGGRVTIGNYAVQTSLQLDVAAGEARLAVYDFAGRANAEAAAYLAAHGAADVARLAATDFRPEPVRLLQADQLAAEARQLLAAAAEDGAALKPQVDALLAKVATLHPQAAADWTAEADLAATLQGSADLFWRLRALAVLNAP